MEKGCFLTVRLAAGEHRASAKMEVDDVAAEAPQWKRRLQRRQIEDRGADSSTKLVDQWLRMTGQHPVTWEVLLNSCPP